MRIWCVYPEFGRPYRVDEDDLDREAITDTDREKLIALPKFGRWEDSYGNTWERR